MLNLTGQDYYYPLWFSSISVDSSDKRFYSWSLLSPELDIDARNRILGPTSDRVIHEFTFILDLPIKSSDSCTPYEDLASAMQIGDYTLCGGSKYCDAGGKCKEYITVHDIVANATTCWKDEKPAGLCPFSFFCNVDVTNQCEQSNPHYCDPDEHPKKSIVSSVDMANWILVDPEDHNFDDIDGNEDDVCYKEGHGPKVSKDGFCSYLPVPEDLTTMTVCEEGSFCNRGMCQKLVQLGEECLANKVPTPLKPYTFLSYYPPAFCVPGSICNLITGLCDDGSTATTTTTTTKPRRHRHHYPSRGYTGLVAGFSIVLYALF